MCNFVSAILTEHHVLFGWSEDQAKMDSHLVILEAFKINDGLDGGDFVKVEVIPKDKSIEGFKDWEFVIDQPETPEWFYHKADEVRVREAIKASGILEAWAKYEKVHALAQAKYEKVHAPALAKYEKVHAPALAEYIQKRKEIASRKW